MAQDALLLPAGMEEAPSAPLDSQTEKYLLFLSDQLLFGVKAEYVVEIITNHTITLLPLVPSYILGIINLRGQIIPIVDMRILLGCPAQPGHLYYHSEHNDTMVGILVDTVQKMMDIEKSAILPCSGTEHPGHGLRHVLPGGRADHAGLRLPSDPDPYLMPGK